MQWAKTVLEQVGFRPVALPLAFLLGLASALASACCTLPLLGAIVGYSGTRQALVERNLECRPQKALQDKCGLAVQALLYATPDNKFYPFCTWNSGPCHRYRIEQEFSKQWGTIFQTAAKLGD